jgi:hypothetical protein
MRWTVAVVAAALVAKDVVGAPRINVMSLVDLLPAWLVDAGYEAVARGLHVGIAVAAGLMLATAFAMAAILSGRSSADRGSRAVQFLTPTLNAASAPVEASSGTNGLDGGLSACERFSTCPLASGGRRRAEIPATALRSPAGPARVRLD